MLWMLTCMSRWGLADAVGGYGDEAVRVVPARKGDWLSHLEDWGVKPRCSDMHDEFLMYSETPYPPRDPEQEINKFYWLPHQTPGAISYFAYGGAKLFPRLHSAGPAFRILVAGAGTGDQTVAYAASFRGAGVKFELVHVDVSATAIEVARARVAARKLDDYVKFLHGNLSSLDDRDFADDKSAGLHGFDWIDASGVLHHLRHPADGLRNLVSRLAPDGGLFAMLYGSAGRAGIYDFQRAYQLLGIPRDPSLAIRMLNALPDSNLLKQNSIVMNSWELTTGGAVGISDMLLNHCDSAFTIPEIVDLASAAGLQVTAILNMHELQVPDALLRIPGLRNTIQQWHWLRRAAFGEAVSTSSARHLVMFVRQEFLQSSQSRDGRRTEAHAVSPPKSMHAVTAETIMCHGFVFLQKRLVFPDDAVAGIREIRWHRREDDYTISFQMPSMESTCTAKPVAVVDLIPYIDCLTSLRDIHRIISQETPDRLPFSETVPTLEGLIWAGQSLTSDQFDLSNAMFFALREPAVGVSRMLVVSHQQSFLLENVSLTPR